MGRLLTDICGFAKTKHFSTQRLYSTEEPESIALYIMSVMNILHLTLNEFVTTVCREPRGISYHTVNTQHDKRGYLCIFEIIHFRFAPGLSSCRHCYDIQGCNIHSGATPAFIRPLPQRAAPVMSVHRSSDVLAVSY